MLFERRGAGHDYEALHVVRDHASGLRAIIAIHSTVLGPAGGGIRRMRYESEAAALDDALRLASAMTLKFALAEVPAGGAKTVVLDHDGLDRPAAYRALGRAVDRLGGRYFCGPDVGTGEAEMAEVRKETAHANPALNDPNGATADGVVRAIRGLLTALDGSPDPAGKRFVVQGLGGVGLAVGERLLAAGAEVVGADPDAGAARAAEARGVNLVAPSQVLATSCDVFVPCAIGGVLSLATAPVVQARGVCGSANNLFADDEAAQLLHRRGVLVVPDFLASPGAAIQGMMVALRGDTDAARAEAAERIDAIEARTVGILEEAVKEGRPPLVVARERALSALGAG